MTASYCGQLDQFCPLFFWIYILKTTQAGAENILRAIHENDHSKPDNLQFWLIGTWNIQ